MARPHGCQFDVILAPSFQIGCVCSSVDPPADRCCIYRLLSDHFCLQFLIHSQYSCCDDCIQLFKDPGPHKSGTDLGFAEGRTMAGAELVTEVLRLVTHPMLKAFCPFSYKREDKS